MAVTATGLPVAKDVRDLLEGLLGRDVTLTDGTRLTDATATMVGVYVDDQLRMRAVVAMDVALAASVGAAIGLMPVGGVEDAVESGEMLPVQQDNTAEVLNVVAALFNVGDAPHLRLYGWYAPKQASPDDVVAAMPALGGRADWRAGVKGYPGGELSILLV